MRIDKLVLYSANLAQLKSFYVEVLNFNLMEATNTELKFQIGSTELIFKESQDTNPYHFAFNIPSNQIDEALVWLKKRVIVLQREGEEILHFESWNAKAVYFHDLDGNIVEFIAREELEIHASTTFSQASILSVSEIGIPSEDNSVVYDFISEKFGLEIYSGTREEFCALGDAEGLFICVNRNERKWIPLGEEAFISDFDMEFSLGNQNFRMKYFGGELS